jgi:hypothetical protein
VDFFPFGASPDVLLQVGTKFEPGRSINLKHMQRLFIAGVLAAAFGASYMIMRKKQFSRRAFHGPGAIDTYRNPEY